MALPSLHSFLKPHNEWRKGVVIGSNPMRGKRAFFSEWQNIATVWPGSCFLLPAESVSFRSQLRILCRLHVQSQTIIPEKRCIQESRAPSSTSSHTVRPLSLGGPTIAHRQVL